jgi:hypothetical protein
MRHLLLILLLAIAATASAQQFLLPAAGSIQGANGTFFRSDVAIWNFRAEPQKIVMRWMPQGATGIGIPPVEITIPPYSGIQDPDFAANVMHQQGTLGAIFFQAVRADGTLDSGQRLSIQSRIYTPQVDSRGNASQSFDAIRITQIAGENRVITNQRNDFRYRLNVGIVNLDMNSSHTWQLVSDNATTPIHVPPFSMHQVSIPRFNNDTTVPLVRILGNGGGQTTWVAYGSSVDNVSGDGWTSLAYPAQLP